MIDEAQLDEPVARADLKRRSVHGAAASFVSQGVRIVTQFIVQILIARLLTPNEFGLVAMVAPIIGFVQLFADMGLAQAIVQRPTLTHRELSGLFWVNAAVCLVLALMLAACAPLVAWFYGEPRTMALTVALAVPMFLGGLASQQMALMTRRMQFVTLSYIDIGSSIVSAGVGIASAANGLGYWSLVLMQMANGAMNLIAAWALSHWRPSFPRREAGIRALLHFGGNVTAFNLVNYLSYNIDSVLIGVTRGNAALGLYNRAFRLMLPSIMQLMAPFTRVAVPLLSRLQDSPDTYRQAFLQTLRTVLLITTPGLVFTIVMGSQAMTTLLGVQWAAAGPIFSWLGFGTLLMPVHTGVSWLFVSQGRVREQLIWGIVGSGIVVISFLIGLHWGPLGIAISATLIAWAVGGPLVFWAATRRGPVRLRDLARAVYPVALAATVAGAVLYGLTRQGGLDGFTGLVIGLAVSYATTLLVLCCLSAGRGMLRDVWRLSRVLRGAAA